jgi:hypothetical protein
LRLLFYINRLPKWTNRTFFGIKQFSLVVEGGGLCKTDGHVRVSDYISMWCLLIIRIQRWLSVNTYWSGTTFFLLRQIFTGADISMVFNFTGC